MIIYFLRHASAGKSKSDPAKDAKRGLDEDGIVQCRLVGSALAALDVAVDVVLSSPLKRATQTASLVATEFGYDGKVVTDKALSPGASFNDFRQLLQKHSRADAMMVVGHNPNLSHFLSLAITARKEGSALELRKGAVAKVDARHRSATLEWLLTPKLVNALYQASPARKKKSRK